MEGDAYRGRPWRSAKVTVEDLKPTVYFVIGKFSLSKTHRQGTSAKEDMLGGFLDRWIKKAAEDLVFRKCLLAGKNFSVVNDYFVYSESSEKNAPDVIGLKVRDRIKVFAQYVGSRWQLVNESEVPYIELKSFKQNQKIIAVRETQLIDSHYYVFVDFDLSPDYLAYFLSSDCFDEKLYKEIEMCDCFVADNTNKYLSPPVKIVRPEGDEIGTISLIATLKGSDFRKLATICEPKESVCYISEFNVVSKGPNSCECKKLSDLFYLDGETGLLRGTYNTSNGDLKVISIDVKQPEKIIVLKVNKNGFYFRVDGDCALYGQTLERGRVYKAEVKVFERGSNWREYVLLREHIYAVSSDPGTKVRDATEELVELLENIAECG